MKNEYASVPADLKNYKADLFRVVDDLYEEAGIMRRTASDLETTLERIFTRKNLS